jgi:hypothetical protein
MRARAAGIIAALCHGLRGGAQTFTPESAASKSCNGNHAVSHVQRCLPATAIKAER